MPDQPPIFVDTETTGLDVDRHHIWEVALIVDDREYQEFVGVPDLSTADPTALDMGRYWDRHPDPYGADPCRETAIWLSEVTAGRQLCGLSPYFDERFLAKWLHMHGLPVRWDYRLIDVRPLAAGYLAGMGTPIPLPWNTTMVLDELGVPEPPPPVRHTALADARMAKAVYEAVTA